MAESQRIEELRRRVQKDPASIAFAQLAEELRRAEQYEESVQICRAGLAIHPGYLSARVTLGRALVELNQLDEALGELTHVLGSAPENLAAIRGVAEIHHRREDLAEALRYYRSALALAKNDPDLQQTVDDLARKVEPPKSAAASEGLSLEHLTRELTLNHPPPKPPAARVEPVRPVEPPKPYVRDAGAELEWGAAEAPKPAPAPAAIPAPVPVAVSEPAHDRDREQNKESEEAKTVAALERWLDAIHVARTDSST